MHVVYWRKHYDGEKIERESSADAHVVGSPD
jgi:hypothetical protein